MLPFFTSLTFLYLLVIAALIVYGIAYYHRFAANRFQHRQFPLVFLIVAAACMGFLYINFHAPLSLKSISNLDHHFIRHDGFRVNGQLELGGSDTTHSKNSSRNQFIFSRKGTAVGLNVPYSEEPFYWSTGKEYQLTSPHFTAASHAVSCRVDSTSVMVQAKSDNAFELVIGTKHYPVAKEIKKGVNAWTLFRDQPDFINTTEYTNDHLGVALKSIFLLRERAGGENNGPLQFFLSGKLLATATELRYDDRVITADKMAFQVTLPDQSSIAWGLGFADNNRNQYRIYLQGPDSFLLLNKYPVSYPLTEENADNWQPHAVHKFLVATPGDLVNMPEVFNEGFLFSGFSADSSMAFAPVLLQYRKEKSGQSPDLQARYLHQSNASVAMVNNQLLLPAQRSGVDWVFSVRDSYQWTIGSRVLSPAQWQGLIFGAMGLFILLILITGLVTSPYRLSWIWQLLSCVTLVLLTTRFFLYWRYKSFPPYEELDLPSVQQLNSAWNFGIILGATVLLALLFGFRSITVMYNRFGKWLGNWFHFSFRSLPDDILKNAGAQAEQAVAKWPLSRKNGGRFLFYGSWILVLAAGGAYAALEHFDPTTCRHLAIVLVMIYFGFIYISYRHSPLTAPAEKSWWQLHTGRLTDLLVNNPVKVLLSISLLALFAFIDIGFAIVFFNFLLFNEAFLCINYGIAGLSAGSNRNAALFAGAGLVYLLLFAANLAYGPYIFNYLLNLPQLLYTTGYALFAISIAYTIIRLWPNRSPRQKIITGMAAAAFLFILAVLFFPKERILDKAAMTKYRIDVMAMPVNKAIETAYEEGKTYAPVIRAAQNQWFINTFIYEKNNPGVNQPAFHLLPHAPQNKGAKYNAQATDLVTSRFLIAEHGKWSVLLYVLLLLLPATLLASFYKLYPDFTNRVNHQYPTITTGFSLLNYLLITALLVILAATGRYIFFGQDLPFASILSKQSILFPCLLIVLVVALFSRVPLEQYPNRKKLMPGFLVFAGLALLLVFYRPAYNKNKTFAVADIGKDMDAFLQLRLQPLLDELDTAAFTRKLSLAQKDRLFTDSVRRLLREGYLDDAGKFLRKEIESYTHTSFARHMDDSRLLYLDMNSGRPQLAINDNYFRVEAPPHLQQFWTGNVYGDTANYNITVWNTKTGLWDSHRLENQEDNPSWTIDPAVKIIFRKKNGISWEQPCLINTTKQPFLVRLNERERMLTTQDTLPLTNPSRLRITLAGTGEERIITIRPDAFMKNYYVNGSRFYVYPLADRFIWARNFAESVAADYTAKGLHQKNVFLSLDVSVMDSLSQKIKTLMATDTSYHNGAEYGICIADGNGRLLSISDDVKGLLRPDPNDKTAFTAVTRGENGIVSQSLLRREIGNINLLRLNPGPGSTLKPIVFSAIASQLNMDWDAFAAQGFSEKQHYYGGERVAAYDFEKNNGRITTVKDYLRYSDNYYHSNLLLLGSYSKQSLQQILSGHFATRNPEAGVHWPWFTYKGQDYWLDGYRNWPGYQNGRADFGSDSSFVSTGLFNNYGIYTFRATSSFEKFHSPYDSSLFMNAASKSGFVMPEYALFDQKAMGVDHRIPYDVFMSSFRGHVKGSSQVMIPPVKMTEAFGKLTSQNRNYSLTLNPWARENPFQPFEVDNGVQYSHFLELMQRSVFAGMHEALFSGTAASLGALLKDGSPYYYYAKTGTTGDDERTAKSKLFVIIISQKNISDPSFNFRKNKFYTIYFTSQNGPAKQNEKFQAAVIRFIEASPAFKKYMQEGNNQ